MKVSVALPLSPSVTVGESMDSADAPSSSVRVSVTSAGAVTPRLLAAVADTVTVLSGASRLLSTPVRVTVPVLVVAPAATVSTLFALSVKSPSTAGATAAADTVTVVASLEARSRVAVTVLMPPFSLIEAWLSDQRDRRRRVVVGNRAGAGKGGLTFPRTSRSPGWTVRSTTVSSGSSTVSPVTETAIVLLVSFGAKVSVPPLSVV